VAKRSLFIPAMILGKILFIFLILYFNLGMFGFDSYIHLQYIDAIIEKGHTFEFSISPSYYDFVGFHVLASGISLITGISSELLYEFISIIIPILIFDLTIIAFIRHTEKKKNGYISNNINLKYLALILLYPSMIGIQMFLARPNSLGISLFSLCLYLYLCKPKSFRAQFIASSLAIVTVKAHHLSALFLIPVIIFVSLFLIKDIKSVISFIYAIPVVIIVNTILASREFEIVNIYLSESPQYANVFNIIVGNKYVFLAIWIFFTFVSYYLRTYQKEFFRTQINKLKYRMKQFRLSVKLDELPSKINPKKLAYLGTIAALIIVEVIGLFIYSASLSSWFISVELVILFILSGISLISSNKSKYSLFTLGFFFYGMTVVSSLLFSDYAELSWVAPRTFVFTIVFISILAYLAVSDLIPKMKNNWKMIFLTVLIFNSYLSISYVGKQYLPSYNLTNNYQNLIIANTMDSAIDFNISRSSIPFSIAKFIDGINIYSLPIILSPMFTMVQNGHHLTHTWLDYIVIGTVMDQWLGLPYHLTQDELMYLLNFYYVGDLSYHIVINNGYNFLLYNLWWV